MNSSLTQYPAAWAGRGHPAPASPARHLRRLLCPLALVCASALAVHAQSMQSSPAAPGTYFEFGTITSIQSRGIELDTAPQGQQPGAHQTLRLTPETRADLVQVGDSVEAVYTLDASGALTLRRLIGFPNGLPAPAPLSAPVIPSAPAPLPASSPSTAKLRDASNSRSSTRATMSAAPSQPAPAPIVRTAPTSSSSPATARGKNAVRSASRTVAALPKPDSSSTPRPTSTSTASRTAVTSAPALATAALPTRTPGSAVPRVTALPRADTPSEECHRSDPNWPAEPLSIAVLDFRYPTANEESHDVGSTGGGSGTALADIVFERLGRNDQFAFIRGDRRRIFREDFAGAARVGRQLGADAVFAGSFEPVEHTDADGFPLPVIWKLKAGVVDTCTGQLLMKLSSDSCATTDASSCAGLSVTGEQAADPIAYSSAFAPLLNPLLRPLDQNRTPPAGTNSSAGTVSAVTQGRVTLALSPGAGLRVGDQVSIHASRLLKNNSTYTLQALQDRQIGQATLTSVHGREATGNFTGDYTPMPGDTMVVPPGR